MSLTIDSSNIKPPDISVVSRHAVYTCSDTHFQIKFLVILYWLTPECIYVFPLNYAMKHFIKLIFKARFKLQRPFGAGSFVKNQYYSHLNPLYGGLVGQL